MELKAYSIAMPNEINTDTILLHLFQDDRDFSKTVQSINIALDGFINELIDNGEFVGRIKETIVIYPRAKLQCKRIIIVGLGSLETYTLDILREASASGINKAKELNAKTIASILDDANKYKFDIKTTTQAFIEGALLATYTYNGQKTGEPLDNRIESLAIIVPDEKDVEAAESGIKRGRAFAEGTMLARDLVNLPPNICTPAYMAQASQDMAKSVNLKCEVLKEQQMRALKMGALLSVAQGSHERPRFIIIEHNTDRSKELETLVLIGKGVTFDTGGYSLKTRDGMVGMKADMGGGAAVIGAMKTIAMLDIPLHVVGLIPASDNNISDKAYRPQEVVTASNGKTIEIISTDAEGRMLLADALVYAKRYNPDAVVDIATLTGACVTALGGAAAGLFCIDNKVRDILMQSGEETQERVWPLPLFPEYTKAIESQTADMKNTGGSGKGIGTSAAFLRNFVDYPVWAHIDMAGLASDSDGKSYITKGGTGYGSRLLSKFTELWVTQGA